jgi:predicted MFS family arabinose efflux permease
MVLSQAPESTGYGLGMSITGAGLLLVPYSLASVLGNRMTLRGAGRFRPDLLLPTGATIYLVSTLGLMRWHDQPWQLFVVMAVAGLGSGCTFAAMPGLIVRFVPLEETGSAMAFNQVLRYLGFSTGSALAPALLHLFARGPVPTAAAFTWAFAVASGIWVLTALGTLALASKAPGPGPRGRAPVSAQR